MILEENFTCRKEMNIENLKILQFIILQRDINML